MKSFFEDIFKYEKFPTEYECFKQLKDCANYIAIPWTQILNSHWLRFPGNRGRDFYLKELSKYTVKSKNNFTVCQHDSFKQLELYFKHLDITKVFCTLHSVDDNMKGIDLLPIPFAFNDIFSSNVEKDLFVSFMGAYTTHPIREVLKNNIIGDTFVYRDTYHIEDLNQDKEKEEREYKEMLERSIFSLCPRGSSPSAVRFWECLSAGTIPILISDNWDLPVWDWDSTIVRIAEQDVATLDIIKLKKLLNSYDAKSMKTQCLKAYEKFKKQNFREYILNNI
tara:strand:+ start:4379 stop:5218 length:840 start_codon:yes stop_codon:yes gene_type:complete